jgi:hypothetical protein
MLSRSPCVPLGCDYLQAGEATTFLYLPERLSNQTRSGAFMWRQATGQLCLRVDRPVQAGDVIAADREHMHAAPGELPGNTDVLIGVEDIGR